MKPRNAHNIKHQITQTFVLVLTATLFAACQDYLPLGLDNGGSSSSSSTPDLFDFSTVKEVTLDINYGKKGAGALIAVYSENPTYVGADDEIHYREEAEFKVFLDGNGCFKGNVMFPADTKKVWVYTARLNVPELMSGEVDGDGEVTVKPKETVSIDNSTPGYNAEEAENENKKFEKVYTINNIKTGYTVDESTGYKVWTVPMKTDSGRGAGKTFSIMNWAGQRFGRIIPTHYYDTDGVRYNVVDKEKTFDNQDLIENLADVVNDEGKKDVLGTKDIEIIQRFLWNGCTTKPESDFSEGGHYLNNRKYYKNLDTEDINTVIPHKYIEDGQVKTLDKAQVWLRFLSEGAYYCDGIGYYYYETGNPPKSMDDIKAYYIAIPNTSSTASYEPEENTFKGRTVPFITYQEVQNGKKTGTRTDDAKYNNGANFIHETTYFKFNEESKKYEQATKQNTTTWTWHPKYVPFDVNQKVQLLYHDIEKGTVSPDFPPGITIGFLLIYNEANSEYHLTGTDEQISMRIDNGSQFYHSDWRVNTPQNWLRDNKGNLISEASYDKNTGEGNIADCVRKDGVCVVGNNVISMRHFIALNYNDFAIYGVEDGVDCSMGDVLFAIETNPMGLVVNDDRVTIDGEMIATTTNHRTYCFEDIWPTGGDYDMNDVVIDHHHRMTIERDGDGDETNDWITRIEDDFTPIQPEGSATYKDAFCIQIPDRRVENFDEEHFQVLRDKMPYDGWKTEVEYNDDNSVKSTVVILFDNAAAQDVRYHTFTVIRNFSKDYAEKQDLRISTTQLERTDGTNILNPFIISQYDKNSEEGRHEIHLPNHSPSPKGLKLTDNTNPAKYYVGKYEGKEYPFAVSLPKSAFNYVWGQHFTDLSSGEGIQIDDKKSPTAYPDFSKWVEEDRDKYAGWYKNMGKSIDGTTTNTDTNTNENN